MKLVIAEKERMALNIAKALGNYKRIRRGFVNIYQLNDALVLPLKGHIMNYVTRKDLTYWNYSSVDKILEDPFSIVKVMSAKGYYSAIRSLAQSCSEIIIATDPDEEGENIGLEIIEVLKGIERPVRRLWLTTTAPSDIRNAFFDLREFNRNVALSVEARRKIDSITGFAGTRELTLRLRKDVVSFGRVQTSTLWMIVVREREIKSFIPVSYWEILADIEGNEFYHVSNPFFDSKLALEKFRRISDARNFVCSKVDYSNEVIHPPRPLNTAEMLKAATSMIRISPSRIMFLAERLYLYGRITYPRVDNQTYTKSFNHKANLERLVKGRFGDYASMLIQQGLLYPTKGRYSEDHQPITPIAPISEINDPAATRLYELILRHYLSLFGPDAIVGLTKVEGKIEDEMFKAEAREIKERGFYKVFYHQPKEKKFTVQFHEGEGYRVNDVRLVEKKTLPPPRYSYQSLLADMEKRGIGTKSTRPQMIDILKKRKYIEVKQSIIYPTSKGVELIEKIEQKWRDYISPEFTSRVEEEMRRVAEGKREWTELVEKERRAFAEALRKLRE